MSDGRVLLDKPVRVVEFLQEQGFGIAKQTVYNQCKAGGLFAPIKTGKHKGKFDAKQVLRAAAYEYADKRKVVDDGQGSEVKGQTGQGGAQALKLDNADKVAADARLKQLQADRAEINLAKLRGELVETASMEEELGKRAKAFRLGLERFGVEDFEAVAALFGGEAEAARELLAGLGVSEDKVPVVVDFMLGRGEHFRRMWFRHVERLLDSYATGTWFTEEMREAWESWEATRAEASNE